MTDTEALFDTERDILLTRCECSHTINAHGNIGHCWLCLDDGRPDCAHDFEDLLAVRVARIVAARVAAARADALAQAEANLLALADREDYDPWAKAIIGNDAIHAVRAAVAVPEPEPTEGDTP